LKAKYRIDVSTTFSVGLFVTVCSVVVGALAGAFHSLLHNLKFLPFYMLMVFLPVWIFVFHWVLMQVRPRWKLLLRVQETVAKILRSMVEMSRMPGLIIAVILLDSCFVLTYAYWSYYLSEIMTLHIPFIIHVMVAYLMKLSLLVKFTPGNIGIAQLFTGGVFGMYGFPIEAGLLISTMQLGLLVVLSFPVAIVLSLLQFKYIRIFIKGINL
jgi:hypothetical protein